MTPYLFILNDPADARYEAQLSKQLVIPEKRRQQIQVYRDRDLQGGEDEAQVRQAALDRAHIVILLVSPDFLSGSCYDLALRALQAKKRVVPVMVRKTAWQEADFGGLRPLPANGVPVELWEDPDSAWVDVVQGLRPLWEQIAAGGGEAAKATAPELRPLAPGAKIKVLFLSANQKDSPRVSFDEEFRQIRDRVLAAQHHDSIELIFEPAMRVNELGAALMRHRPHIVHFSGHGTQAGAIVLADPQSPGVSKALDPALLRGYFALVGQSVYCVVLNSCWSARDEAQAQTQALADVAGCVIGMADTILDRSAIEFASSFYQALAFGQPVKTAYDLAALNVAAVGQPDAGILRLAHRASVDPAALRLISAP